MLQILHLIYQSDLHIGHLNFTHFWIAFVSLIKINFHKNKKYETDTTDQEREAKWKAQVFSDFFTSNTKRPDLLGLVSSPTIMFSSTPFSHLSWPDMKGLLVVPYYPKVQKHPVPSDRVSSLRGRSPTLDVHLINVKAEAGSHRLQKLWLVLMALKWIKHSEK